MALGEGVVRGQLARNPVEASLPRARRTQRRKGWTFEEAKSFL